MTAGQSRLCGRCGRVRPISRRAGPDGPDICSGCYRPPTAVCSGCGRQRPCTGIAAGRPLCTRCTPLRTSICAHCGQARPAAARWPEGPVCDHCYTRALRHTGTCPGCGEHHRLVDPPGPQATICAGCAGTGPTGHVCVGCGCEDKLFDRGYCNRCSLTRRTDTLLTGTQLKVPAALVGVRDAIITNPNPRTALNWLRTGAGAPLLAALAAGEIPLSHSGLDTQPAGRAVDYLRALLIAHGALPARDEQLAKLERRIAGLLADVADADDRRAVTAFATWHVLQRVRRRAERRPAAATATRHATVAVRAAIALLEWLTLRGVDLAGIRQSDLDRWILDGPPQLVHQACDFLGWAAQRRIAPRLRVTTPIRPTGPATGETQRRTQIQLLLHDPNVATIDRVAGCLVLLYAQQLSRIARMTRNQIHQHGDTLTVRFGSGDITIDEPLAGFIRAQLTDPLRHQSLGASTETNWLFPGHLPGRPITPACLGGRLGALGINAQTGRRSAIQQLAIEVPAAVLADLIGIAVTTAVKWAHTAGGDYSRYAADIARTQQTTPTRVTTTSR